MVLLLCRSLLLSLLAISAFAGPSPNPPTVQERTCATSDPEDDLLAHHHRLHRREHIDTDPYSPRAMQNLTSHFSTRDVSDPYTVPAGYPTFEPIYTIETYFHLVLDTNSETSDSATYISDDMAIKQFTYISDDMAIKQFAYIANMYAPYGVAFTFSGMTRTINNDWANNADDSTMKQNLRVGTYSTLNVYFQTQRQAYDNDPDSLILGFCSLPRSGITSTTSPSDYVLDGCNILSGTMPGSWLEDYNLGGTAIHEIGHWNGLLHPFQGTTCDAENYGDYVADTPQENEESKGCPIGRDTCPNSGLPAGEYDGSDSSTTDPYGPQGIAGPDPVTNFMDYSQDSCYTGFSRGQAARIVNLWILLRMGL